jgi:hypothetical protein
LRHLNLHAATHAKWFQVGYLGLFAVLLLAVVWPPSYEHVYYLGAVGDVTSTTNITGGHLMEIDYRVASGWRVTLTKGWL